MATMTKRQAAFRADYRQRISPWYSGPFHVVMIYALGIAMIAIAVFTAGMSLEKIDPSGFLRLERYFNPESRIASSFGERDGLR